MCVGKKKSIFKVFINLKINEKSMVNNKIIVLIKYLMRPSSKKTYYA